jgi:hypothetical protein
LYKPSSQKDKHDEHVWPGFLVLLLTNLLGLIVIIVRQDVVWCIAAVWACVGLWLAGPNPALIFVASFPLSFPNLGTYFFARATQVTAILFTVLHPLALIASILWHALSAKRKRREGPIALPPDRDDEPSSAAGADGEHTPGGRPRRTGVSREVDAEALFG